MRVTPHEPIGATLRSVELSDFGESEQEQLRDLLAEHGVLVLPGQHIDDDEFVAFLSGLGELQFTDGEAAVPDRDDLNVVTNVGRKDTPVSNWHVDTAYVDSPPAYTALRAVEVPEHGGETLFSNQFRAWETLDPALRNRVRHAELTHVVTGVDPGPGAQTEADHPVVRPHPRSGRLGLFLDAPRRCRAISDMSSDESASTIAALLCWSTRPENVFRHQWSPGDVVIWDNAAVLHRADHSGVIGDRIFHRGMIASDGYGVG